MWQKGFSNNPDWLSRRLIGWSGAKKHPTEPDSEPELRPQVMQECQYSRIRRRSHPGQETYALFNSWSHQTYVAGNSVIDDKASLRCRRVRFDAKAKLLFKKKDLKNGPEEPVYFAWPHRNLNVAINKADLIRMTGPVGNNRASCF